MKLQGVSELVTKVTTNSENCTKTNADFESNESKKINKII